MPRLSDIVAETWFSRLGGGNNLQWLPDSGVPIGTRRILSSVDTRMYWVVMTAFGVEENIRLVGEIIVTVSKDLGYVFAPVTLCTFHRAASAILDSTIDAVRQGQADIAALLRANLALSQLPDRTSGNGLAVQETVGLITSRLKRARTRLRDSAHDLASRGNLAGAVQKLDLQASIDAKSLVGMLKRVDLALVLWEETGQELKDLFELLESPLTDTGDIRLVTAMEGLQIKPMIYAVSYSLRQMSSGKDQEEVKRLVRSAFIGELIFVNVEAILSIVKHDPHQFDRITQIDFAINLPRLEFDEPYRQLARCLEALFGQMRLAFKSQRYDEVSLLARSAQGLMRNRQDQPGNAPWHHNPIVSGQVRAQRVLKRR